MSTRLQGFLVGDIYSVQEDGDQTCEQRSGRRRHDTDDQCESSRHEMQQYSMLSPSQMFRNYAPPLGDVSCLGFSVNQQQQGSLCTPVVCYRHQWMCIDNFGYTSEMLSFEVSWE